MTTKVKCPLCASTHLIRSSQRFFRCCGVLNSVENNKIGEGITRKEFLSKLVENSTENSKRSDLNGKSGFRRKRFGIVEKS